MLLVVEAKRAIFDSSDSKNCLISSSVWSASSVIEFSVCAKIFLLFKFAVLTVSIIFLSPSNFIDICSSSLLGLDILFA
jgi:hypothetical protein